MTCHLLDTNRHLDAWPPTPLTRVAIETRGPCIWAKLEFMNPADRPRTTSPTIVTVFCDRMECYFSTELFQKADA